MKSTGMLLLTVGFSCVIGTSLAAQDTRLVSAECDKCQDDNKNIVKKYTNGIVTRYRDTPVDVESFPGIAPVSGQVVTTEDKIVVTLSLKSISDILTFNKVTTPEDCLEYSWDVKIDTNSDNEYDVQVSMKSFKSSEDTPEQGTILSHTQKNTWIYEGDYSWSYGHPIEAYIDYNTKSIVMTADKNWDELKNFDQQDTFTVETYYMGSGDGTSGSDTTAIETVRNVISDPENDVSYSFIDIVNGSVTETSGDKHRSLTPIIQTLLL